MNGITVLKFGSSVLGRGEGIGPAVQEIYDHWRKGRGVVAVVSAFAGVTDGLMQRVRTRFGALEGRHSPALIANGEIEAAVWLALALEESGLAAEVLDPARLSLAARGAGHDADLCDVDETPLRAALAMGAIAVVPGFAARDVRGRTVLLGRGGSDLTALFLAHRLDASCKLVKDVDGLYTADPASGNALRWQQLSWEEAASCCGRALQAKALHFARQHALAFEVGACVSALPPTRVGPFPPRLEEQGEVKPLRVALAGLGVVNGGVAARLAALPHLYQITGALVRDGARPRGPFQFAVHAESIRLHAERAPQVLVEALGGVEPARSIQEAALRAGVHVVSANKSVLAAHGVALAKTAASHNATLRASAAAGGALPVLETATRLGEEAAAFTAVLNGTCAFLLEQAGAGVDFDTALRQAQERGFAEADPSRDLTGADAADKAVLIARAAWGTEISPERIARRTLDRGLFEGARLAASAGRRLCLLTKVERTAGGATASVLPVVLPLAHPFERLSGPCNALLIQRRDGAQLNLAAAGAGRWPTSLAVVADLVDLARELRRTDTPAETTHPALSSEARP